MLLQVLVLLVAVEAVLRLARPHHRGLAALLYSPRVATDYDRIGSTRELLEQTGIGFHPGLEAGGFRLNSRGFRTPEYRETKAPGTLRVVVLGDSFAFASGGVPWSLMWTTTAERRLEASLGREVEVISLGFPGEGPRFALAAWELEGSRLDPDLVVLAFFVGNDFTDEQDRRGEVDPEPALVRWSATARLVRNLWRLRGLEGGEEGAGRNGAASPAGWGEAEGAAGEAGAGRFGVEVPGAVERYRDDVPLLDEATFRDVERARLELFLVEREAWLDELFADVARVLSRLDREVELAGAELLVVLVPAELQVHGELLADLLAAEGIDRSAVDLDRPQRRLAAFLEAEGIAHLDLLSAFRREAGERRLYGPRNTHWNLAGNALAGEEVAASLESLLE